MNASTFGDDNGMGWTLYLGTAMLIGSVWVWFGQAIRENLAGLNSAQLKHSYALGMYWFIFSEIMFFLAFFGTLFRPAQLVLLTSAVSPDERGLAIGLNTSASYIGLTVGSVASAAVVTGVGYGALGWAALAFTGLAALVVEQTKSEPAEEPS